MEIMSTFQILQAHRRQLSLDRMIRNVFVESMTKQINYPFSRSRSNSRTLFAVERFAAFNGRFANCLLRNDD